MRRFRDLISAHKRFSFGVWIVALVAVVAGAQWQLTSGGSKAGTQVLGVSVSAPSIPLITSSPSDPTSATTATFTYTSQNGASFQCQLDGTATFSPSPCAKSGVTYTGLTIGTHTFRVAAQQGNGLLSAPRGFTWSVVAPPAAPTITVHPDDPTSDTTATFGFTGTGSFQCTLDGTSFATCTSTKTYNGLAAGDHTFSVRALDSGGNPSSAASFPWTIATGNFGISGNLDATLHPLYPGMAPAPLDLTFINPYSFALNISSVDLNGRALVRVAVQQTTYLGTAPNLTPNANCHGSDLSVTQAAPWTITVPRNSTRSLSQLGVLDTQWPSVAMPNTDQNQDGCKSTTFKFTYTGTATK